MTTPTAGHYISRDLIIEILVRLPVKSLLRCKSFPHIIYYVSPAIILGLLNTNVWRKVKSDFPEAGDSDFNLLDDFPKENIFDVCVNGSCVAWDAMVCRLSI